MTSFPVEEPPSKMVVRLRIKYNRITIVLNTYICIINKVMRCLLAVAFFLDTLYHLVSVKLIFLALDPSVKPRVGMLKLKPLFSLGLSLLIRASRERSISFSLQSEILF